MTHADLNDSNTHADPYALELHNENLLFRSVHQALWQAMGNVAGNRCWMWDAVRAG